MCTFKITQVDNLEGFSTRLLGLRTLYGAQITQVSTAYYQSWAYCQINMVAYHKSTEMVFILEKM